MCLIIKSLSGQWMHGVYIFNLCCLGCASFLPWNNDKPTGFLQISVPNVCMSVERTLDFDSLPPLGLVRKCGKRYHASEKRSTLGSLLRGIHKQWGGDIWPIHTSFKQLNVALLHRSRMHCMMLQRCAIHFDESRSVGGSAFPNVTGGIVPFRTAKQV